MRFGVYACLRGQSFAPLDSLRVWIRACRANYWSPGVCGGASAYRSWRLVLLFRQIPALVNGPSGVAQQEGPVSSNSELLKDGDRDGCP